MDFTVGIVSQNLVTTSNFVEFRDSRNLHVFGGNERRAGHLVHFLVAPRVPRVKLQFSQVELKVGPTMTHGMMSLDRKVKLMRIRDIIGIMGKF